MPETLDSPVIETADEAVAVLSTRLPIRLGFELEFAGPRHGGLLDMARRAGIDIVGSNESNERYSKWQLTYDESVMNAFGPDHLARMQGVTHREDVCGFELRSPRMTPLSPQMPVLRQLLRCWRGRIAITRTSGMHVHLSCKQRGAVLDGQRFARLLDRRYREMLWRDRRSYTHEGWSTYERYHTVRQVEERRNHVEVRLFNGTLNLNRINRRLRYAWRFYRDCLSFDGRDGHGNVISTVAVA